MEKKQNILMTEAFELLEIGEERKALRIGQQLEKMNYSGAFEIQALAYNNLGKKKKAIKILKKGTEAAPDIWLLWQLLGNYYSDENQFDKAFEIFEKGLETADPDKVSLNYNYAIALERSGNLSEAQSRVTDIFSDQHFPDDIETPLYLLILALYCSFLNKEGQYKEVISFFEKKKPEILKHEIESHSVRSRLFAEIATSYFKLDQINEASSYLRKTINADKHNADAQWLYREINKNDDYSKAKFFRITIHGKWLEPLEGETVIPDFYTTYEVIANDENEAFNIIKQFEPIKLHESLKIEELKILKKPPNQPKGVYETAGYAFYTENDNS